MALARIGIGGVREVLHGLHDHPGQVAGGQVSGFAAAVDDEGVDAEEGGNLEGGESGRVEAAPEGVAGVGEGEAVRRGAGDVGGEAAGGVVDDDAFLLGTNLFREAGYTGGSRSRSGTHLYLVAPKPPKHLTRDDMIDPIMDLSARLGVSRAQLLATDQLHPAADKDLPIRPIRELAGDAKRLAATLTAAPPPPGDARRWAAEHQGDIDRWCQLQDDINRQRSVLGVAALYDPPAHLVNTLGPPPVTGADRHRWAETAGRVESYRAAHGIDDTTDLLGPKPDDIAEVVEWRHTQAAVDCYAHRHLDQGLHL
jgi:hypothetical protein